MDFLVSLGARLPSCKNCRSGAAPCNAHPWAALIGAIRSQGWANCRGSGRIASPFLQYTIVNPILQKEKLKTLQRRTLRGYSCKIFGDYRSAGTLHIYPHNSIRVIKKPPKVGAGVKFAGAPSQSPLSSIEILSSGAWILTVSTDSPMTRPMESRTWLAVCSCPFFRA